MLIACLYASLCWKNKMKVGSTQGKIFFFYREEYSLFCFLVCLFVLSHYLQTFPSHPHFFFN